MFYRRTPKPDRTPATRRFTGDWNQFIDKRLKYTKNYAGYPEIQIYLCTREDIDDRVFHEVSIVEDTVWGLLIFCKGCKTYF